MTELYAAHKAVFWLSSLVVAVLLCTVHYFLFVRHEIKSKYPKPTQLVTRFNIRELISHWLRIILFLTLAYTGIEILFKSGTTHLGAHHGFTGVAFLILLIIGLVSWGKDMVFHKYDLIWLQRMGGYFTQEAGTLPAGRFNGGQKMFFWLMFIAALVLLITAVMMEQEAHHTLTARLGIAWTIHGLTGCLATIMVIGHAYLSLLVNPECARVMLDGKMQKVI